MGDILTQIQDDLDMLLNMMSRDLAHIRESAPPGVPPGQQRLESFAELEARNAAENSQSSSNPTQQAAPNGTPAPPSQEQFQADIKERAADMVLKFSAIEKMIASLPGLKSSEQEQIERMKELEGQLEELEGERVGAVKEKERLLGMVEEKIMGVGRVR
ncbi:RNA polymerase II mediator complex subunit [Neocucurbitaria cava]|uniref:Mediator of RNA polymerase II transcription subunit 21 n=1 Tax=Neocucurbitaria cava TaxID=798079 RepID=A0A9W8Y3F1_9PLEO|nr:RNA polymerase II mediator complex subunit [Neocucurbitaria cava]